MSTLVKPYIEKLKSTPLDAIQTNHLHMIETNLEQIVSPFVRDIGSRVLELTPMEIGWPLWSKKARAISKLRKNSLYQKTRF